MSNEPHASAGNWSQLPPPSYGTPAPQQAVSAAFAPGSVGLEAARVLVVNGLLGCAETIEPYATASGITCQSYARAHSALAAMKQAAVAGNSFHVVFVERVLPDMDPFEFAESVARDKQLAQARLILVSTFGPNNDEERVRKHFFAHLAKPTKQVQVLDAVHAAISGNPQLLPSKSRSVVLPAARSGNHVILIAEDNPVTQMLVLMQLKERGFFAQVVTNGQEAVQAARKHDFDAILMDCQMPVLDGFQASMTIRNWEQQTGKPRIPIIAMTAFTGDNDRSRCLQAGMDDYMSKPVTYDKLEAVLSKWLNFKLSFNTEAAMDKQNEFRSDWKGPQPSAVPVDLNALSEMLGSNEAEEILQLFITSTQDLLDRISIALATRDAGALQEAAHTLKGASSSIGANPLWQKTIDLEKAAKSEDWQHIPQLFAGVLSSFEEAKSFIKNH